MANIPNYTSRGKNISFLNNSYSKLNQIRINGKKGHILETLKTERIIIIFWYRNRAELIKFK